MKEKSINTSPACFRMISPCLAIIICCFGLTMGPIGNAKAQSAPSQFDKKPSKHRAAFKLAQQSTVVDPAQAKNSQTQVPPKKTQQKKPPAISGKRRTELMEFVNAHHSAIRPLLIALRKTRQPEYQAAMKTLDREVKILQALEKQSPERYARSLEQWTIKSKIKLLAARLAMRGSQKDQQSFEDELKQLIERQHQLKVEQAKDDLIIARKRVERLETLESDLKTNQDKMTQQQLNSITKNARRLLMAQKQAVEAIKQARVFESESAKNKDDEKDKPNDK